MGRIKKGQACNVEGCSKKAVRSVSAIKVSGGGLKISGSRRGFLCSEHYKEYKKNTRKTSRLEKWRFNTFR